VQVLALKPKMLQSLQMLSLPLLELEMHIKQELQVNPILELQEEEEEFDFEKTEKEDDSPESNSETDEAGVDSEADELMNQGIEEIKEFSEILDDFQEFHREHKDDSKDRDIFDTYNAVEYDEAIKDKKHLFYSQLEDLNLSLEEMIFARELVENCDQHGYLPDQFDIYQLAAETLSDSLTEDNRKLRADEIHQQILRLNPAGITARNIKECLLAQIPEDDRDFPIIRKILLEHFDDLIHRRYQKISSKLSVTTDKILQCKQKIGRLNPKPGLELLSVSIDYVTPDVIIKNIENEFVIILNDYNMPRLMINRHYRDMILTKKIKDRQIIEYVREKINSAKFLIKSVYMRNRTLTRVTRAIIENQKNFFYNNSGILEPMTYSVIAQELGVNESTISRVVKHKYADTPFGVICLKDFFTSSAGRTDDFEEISRQNVQKHIQEIIEKEDKEKPVSDLEIAKILHGMNLNVSRRVIAKYRESMRILNSRLRRLAE